jgi:hypothetical protein
VRDETLLFVPSDGEPVEWKRGSIARDEATRRADLAKQDSTRDK